ncbi:putative S-adenosylmethionine-dependent methyltransferase [uncultured archaeon]|nr:putative S-adenosylmethionine-dependent methyltransferase [uncultured archaeon]
MPDATQKFLFRGQQFICPKGAYLPSDDSFLLAEATKVPQGGTCLDMGCGPGTQSISMLMQGAAKVIAADINEKALEAAKKNCISAGYGNKMECVKSDLFENVDGNFDLIVFNPPYLPVNETEKKYIDLDGGKKGREVLDRFLEQMPGHLKKNGECYFLQTDINGTAKTEKALKSLGMEFEITARKRIFFEELIVYRARKK